MDYINWFFFNVETTLHAWDKSYLVVVYHCFILYYAHDKTHYKMKTQNLGAVYSKTKIFHFKHEVFIY